LPNGVFITITPLAVAVGMSTLIDADPGPPDDPQLLSFFKKFGVIFGGRADREPTKSPIIFGELVLCRRRASA